MPGLITNMNNTRVIADHRQKALLSNDKAVTSFEGSTLGVADDHTHRNISQSAWNKIRQVELRKKQRLIEFNP